MISAIFLYVALSAYPSRAETAPSSTTVVPPPSATTSPTAPIYTGPPLPSNAPFLETFPQMKDYLYDEPRSGFFIGHGGSPVGFIRSTYMFTADIFELHWIKDRYDIQAFDISYALGRGSSSEFTSQRFAFRFAPKYRVFGPISIGPTIGYELVNFPNVGARLFRDTLIAPNSEPFSVRGWVYGLNASETFNYGKKYLFKLDEVVYQETYSTKKTAEGWSYIFDDQAVQLDNSQINAGTVIMIEASFLY